MEMPLSMKNIFNINKMLNEEEDSPTKCRERRRHRVEMRRMAVAAVYPTGSSSPAVESFESVSDAKVVQAQEALPDEEARRLFPLPPSVVQGPVPTVEAAPVFGSMSVSGRSREMEDAICVRTDLCRPEINHCRPVHFFAVFDGHGGVHVAKLCKEKMHVFMEEELMRVEGTCCVPRGIGGNRCGSREIQEAEERCWMAAIRRCFMRMDDVAINSCACGKVGSECGCHPVEVALSGSTAVVAVVTATHIIVANCGDSRAVLCRAGRALPLSSDHKPDRPNEKQRIAAAGGRVIYNNGARVEGILAMSRALGDNYLKHIITSEPEISFTRRTSADECLILASDGLWDVLTSELACEVASKCLQEGSPATTRSEAEGSRSLYPSRSASASALLTCLALGRKSSDNISVIIVDLKDPR
ncbi:Phosphoprotein phosphatase [Bertholletia excelsa]